MGGRANKDSLWIIGTGESCSRYTKDMKELASRTTLTLHDAFPNCLYQYGWTPTYWTWYDPSASLEGLEFLIKFSPRVKPRILLVKPYLEYKNRLKYIKNVGSSAAAKSNERWMNYLGLVREVESRGTPITRVPAAHPVHILRNPGNNIKVIHDLMHHNGTEILNKARIIMGTSLVGRRQYVLENKLTSLMLPLAVHMGFKKIFVVGFDYKGGRFFDVEKKISLSQHLRPGVLAIWNRWGEIFGFNIYSVADPSLTKASKYLKYMPFDKALEESG